MQAIGTAAAVRVLKQRVDDVASAASDGIAGKRPV
jgi:hypothetical protein